MEEKLKFNLTPPREVPEFPAEVTFKAIYHNAPLIMDMLNNVFSENNISPRVISKTSRNSKFISYTVTAVFQSKEQLDTVCSRAASIEGFTTMF